MLNIGFDFTTSSSNPAKRWAGVQIPCFQKEVVGIRFYFGGKVDLDKTPTTKGNGKGFENGKPKCTDLIQTYEGKKLCCLKLGRTRLELLQIQVGAMADSLEIIPGLLEMIRTRLGDVKTCLEMIGTCLGEVRNRLEMIRSRLGRVRTCLGMVRSCLGEVRNRLEIVWSCLGGLKSSLEMAKRHVVVSPGSNNSSRSKLVIHL